MNNRKQWIFDTNESFFKEIVSGVKRIEVRDKLEERIKKLENEIQQFKERNYRVESDKAWETSPFRIFSITAITYIIAVIVMYIIGAQSYFLSALIPTIGYYLSTQSLPWIKKRWIKRYENKK